ncbi:unnamed protein product [Closterium sp. NIES-64]|nr:unnamed protein product [Closterium sp. NIES-64]
MTPFPLSSAPAVFAYDTLAAATAPASAFYSSPDLPQPQRPQPEQPQLQQPESRHQPHVATFIAASPSANPASAASPASNISADPPQHPHQPQPQQPHSRLQAHAMLIAAATGRVALPNLSATRPAAILSENHASDDCVGNGSRANSNSNGIRDSVSIGTRKGVASASHGNSAAPPEPATAAATAACDAPARNPLRPSHANPLPASAQPSCAQSAAPSASPLPAALAALLGMTRGTDPLQFMGIERRRDDLLRAAASARSTCGVPSVNCPSQSNLVSQVSSHPSDSLSSHPFNSLLAAPSAAFPCLPRSASAPAGSGEGGTAAETSTATATATAAAATGKREGEAAGSEGERGAGAEWVARTPREEDINEWLAKVLGPGGLQARGGGIQRREQEEMAKVLGPGGLQAQGTAGGVGMQPREPAVAGNAPGQEAQQNAPAAGSAGGWGQGAGRARDGVRAEQSGEGRRGGSGWAGGLLAENIQLLAANQGLCSSLGVNANSGLDSGLNAGQGAGLDEIVSLAGAVLSRHAAAGAGGVSGGTGEFTFGSLGAAGLGAVGNDVMMGGRDAMAAAAAAVQGMYRQALVDRYMQEQQASFEAPQKAKAAAEAAAVEAVEAVEAEAAVQRMYIQALVDRYLQEQQASRSHTAMPTLAAAAAGGAGGGGGGVFPACASGSGGASASSSAAARACAGSSAGNSVANAAGNVAVNAAVSSAASAHVLRQHDGMQLKRQLSAAAAAAVAVHASAALPLERAAADASGCESAPLWDGVSGCAGVSLGQWDSWELQQPATVQELVLQCNKRKLAALQETVFNEQNRQRML